MPRRNRPKPRRNRRTFSEAPRNEKVDRLSGRDPADVRRMVRALVDSGTCSTGILGSLAHRKSGPASEPTKRLTAANPPNRK